MKRKSDHHAEKFTEIYKNNIWGNGIDIPLSGSGSLPKNSEIYSQIVQEFISEYRIDSVLDIGHGDWQMWNKYRFENTKYMGIDVANNLSAQLNKKHGTSQIQFKQLNCVTEALPKADLLICKDVLQHLSNSDIEICLKKFTEFKYLILCNDIRNWNFKNFIFRVRALLGIRSRISNLRSNRNFKLKHNLKNNLDIKTGECRCIDLKSPPFKKNLSNFKILNVIRFGNKLNFGIEKEILLLERL